MTTLYARFLICNDGVVLESRHSWDYKSHTDADGNYYFLDGGVCDFYRRSPIGTIFEVTDETEHVIARDWLSWGRSFDKHGNWLDKTQYIKLKDISNNHLQALIDLVSKPNYELIKQLFEKELAYRQDHDIVVPDYD